jgi:Domain of unknown function (DUF4357)
MEKLFIKTVNISAEAYYKSGCMTILKGSKASSKTSSSLRESMIKLRQDLISLGTIKEIGGEILFTEDYTCSSPSQASGLLNGTSSNGLISWKDSSGKTLKSILKQKW